MTEYRHLALTIAALSVLLAQGCSTDTTSRDDAGTDANVGASDAASTGDGDGDGGGDGDDEPDAGGQGMDAGPGGDDACVPKGCEEQGFECGIADDGCGGELNCDPPGGDPCLEMGPFMTCGGDPDLGPNVCGCKPKTCETLVEGGAQCGADIPDGCGGLIPSCGQGCLQGNLCSNSFTCVCIPTPDPCGDKVCGTVSDGCSTVSCGSLDGACPEGRTCSADQLRCDCPDQQTACEGKTGEVTIGTCSYNCTKQCGEAERLAACGDATCGTARDECGNTVNCGANAGGCPSGQACANHLFIQDKNLPTNLNGFNGGYCVPQAVAYLVGKYAARVHSFRQAEGLGSTILTRAEAVQRIRIDYNRARDTAILTDQGCVGSGIVSPTSIVQGTVSIPGYSKVPPVTVEIPNPGMTWVRLPVPNPELSGGQGVPAGFRPGVPDYCKGHEGSIIDLPAGDPRRGNALFSGNKCQCPTAESARELPGPDNYKTSGVSDCRVFDEDGDGKAGYTVSTRAGILSTEVYNATISETVARMVTRADRHHLGYGDDPYPTKRVVLGCSSSLACAAPKVDCGCEPKWNRIQFVPLPPDAPLTCESYYLPNGRVDQDAIELQFGKGFGTCSASQPCPEGTLCHGSVCKPTTSKGVCGVTCPEGTYCEGCPAGSECLGTSCWPKEEVCSAQNAELGGICTVKSP